MNQKFKVLHNSPELLVGVKDEVINIIIDGDEMQFLSWPKDLAVKIAKGILEYAEETAK